MTNPPPVVYAFRLNEQDKWSFSDKPPALKGIAHETQVFIPDGGITKINSHGFSYRADQR